jgi:hypothetical protein
MSGPASAAAASAGAAPASGSTPIAFDASRFDPSSASADWGCRWNCGWGRGWGRGWDRGRGWRRNRIDAGDVIIGAAIIGGLAAILSSENRRRRERDVVVIERDPDLRDRDWRDDRRARPIGTADAGTTSGLDNAAAMCVDAVERNARVDSVDNVSRNASGWDVTGTLGEGQGFRCRIGNDGRVAAIDYDDSFGSADAGQWNEDVYAAAREQIGGTVRPDIAVQEATFGPRRGAAAPGSMRPATDRMPAYPGGPIPGEEIPEEASVPLPGR